MNVSKNIITWPRALLTPETTMANVAPFTRSGGRSLSSEQPAVRTDRGHWRVDLQNICISEPEERRCWQAIKTILSGRAGLISVPVWSFASAPYNEAMQLQGHTTPHNDDTSFDDDTFYDQGNISVRCAKDFAIGDTRIKLEIVNASPDLSGISFSYFNAMYETGRTFSIVGNVHEVEITPAGRSPIPADAPLEFDYPTCLCRLASDRGMDHSLSHHGTDMVSVSFVEAVDYWSELAAGLIT